MIILFNYCADMKNYESFKGFHYIYILAANPCDVRENYWNYRDLLDPNLSNRSVAFVLGQTSLTKKTN